MTESKQLKRPQRLQRGDRIGVVSPAGWVHPEEMERGLKALRAMGFHPVLGRQALSRHRYFAGGDAERAEDLMRMFADPEIRGIVCARGGYGSSRLIEHLDARVIRRQPKVFVGSSDITSLLLYLTQKCGLVAFHGPMVAGSFGRKPMPQSRRRFKKLLQGDPKSFRLAAPKAHVLRPGTARGRLTGGCLTLLCRSLGTPWEIQTRGAILLIEDVNEPPYRIDGMLSQLKQAGKFEGVRGVIFGEMVQCHPPAKESWTLRDAVADIFRDYSFPILFGCPIGHGDEIWTVPFGTQAVLNADRRHLELEECGVV
jgi:muramoyltetrapeptide carboxypeptidase